MRHAVCKLGDLPVEQLTPVPFKRSKLVLWREKDGAIRAFSGRCPHQGADMEFGCVSDLTEGSAPNEVRVACDEKVVRCPWHGFEYSLATGESVVPAESGRRLRLRTFPVEIDGDQVFVLTS